MTAGTIAPDQLDRIARALAPEACLIRTWELPGGVSAQVLGLEIERADGTPLRAVLRRGGGQ